MAQNRPSPVKDMHLGVQARRFILANKIIDCLRKTIPNAQDLVCAYFDGEQSVEQEKEFVALLEVYAPDLLEEFSALNTEMVQLVTGVSRVEAAA